MTFVDSYADLCVARAVRRGDRRNHPGRRVAAVLVAALTWAPPASFATVAQDEIFGDGYDGFDTTTCDGGLPIYATDAGQYAAAIDICKTTTEQAADWGLISATLTLASGSDPPAATSRAIRPTYGTGITPHAGAALAVLSTGTAAGSSDAGFIAPQPGADMGKSSAVPADWLTANGGAIPVAPGCPAANNTTAHDPVMLTLRIRVPSNARSFSLDANFLSSEYPEWVCTAFNDMFVALLDSSFAGLPANPADKNLANYTTPGNLVFPLGVNLAVDNTGLFRQCVNASVGCSGAAITTCTGTSELAGTGMDTSDPGNCDANGLVGGGTGWLVIRGNVVPGEIIELRLAIWDTGDGFFDSDVVLDNFRWSFDVATPGVTIN